jgi:ATP-dependent DNA helicase RecG
VVTGEARAGRFGGNFGRLVAMRLSDDELGALVATGESDHVEWKGSLAGDAPTKLREAICAFANDLPGHGFGVAILGLQDDGQPSGVQVSDRDLQQLADMREDGQIVPPPSIAVEKRRVRNAEVAVVTVLASDSPPVRYRGNIWIRSGPRRSRATAQDERILNERRRHGDRPFDLSPIRSMKLKDLDIRLFEDEYLPSAFSQEVLEANERSIVQRLAATKMIVSEAEPTPTVLGALVLSPTTRDFMPGAYVQFLRVQGDRLSDPIIDEQLIDGTLMAVVRRLDEKCSAHNMTTVDLVSGPVERRRSAYPIAAIQQLTRNAIMHRTYEATNAPVRFTWYDDRIEILSPGGPFGQVSVRNFGRAGLADYRNPNVAEAMRVLGLVQRFGAGIDTARRELARNGNPPLEFDVDDHWIAATLRPTS